MNQQIPTGRPPQRAPQQTPPRSPQRPQQRPPQRPPQRPHRPSKYGTGFVVLLVTTVALLLISLIVLGVVLCVGGMDSNPKPTDGADRDDTPKQEQPQTPTTTVIRQKTKIALPCATKSNSSYSFDNVTAIADGDGIESQAAALLDVTNGKAVAGKNGNDKVYPASMTKVMTLLVACENATNPTELLTITDAMVSKYKSSYNPGELGPSVAFEWSAGDQITVEDAMHLVIYESDTYACWLLAEHVAGSEEAFVKMMNDKVVKLGLANTTHFENSTGLYHDNHYTTCFDMATIMAAAMNNDAAKIVLTATSQYTFEIYRDGSKYASRSVWSGWYTGRLEAYRYGKAAPKYAGNGSDIAIIAGKTGYETVPKYCFVTAGQNDVTGTLFVCVQVGGADPKASTDDTREIYQKFAKY